MNRKLLQAKPLQYTIDILLQVWFHLMGYVVRVYWLDASKPDWSCVIWHANKMRDPLSYRTIWYIFKVNAIFLVLLKGRFHRCRSIQEWTCNLSHRKFWVILQHPYGNHINLGLHQHYNCYSLSPIPEYCASERPGSPWDGWLTLSEPPCITRGLHLLFSPPLGPFILPVSPFSLHHFHSAIFFFFLFGHLSCGTVVSIPRFSNLLSNLLGSVEAFLSFYRVEIEIRVSITSTEMDAGPRAPSP